jgi:exodeoxyribonuclease VII small subunit
MAKSKKDPSFETRLDRIEEIIDKLNDATLPLEDALKLHQEASVLIAECEEYLNKATLQFETLE